MDLIRVPDHGRPIIQSYGAGGFRIANTRYDGAVLLRPEGAESVALTTLGHVDNALAARIAAFDPRPEILLVGSGPMPQPLPEAAREILRAAAIGTEIMATGPACRTFNVLLGEGRRVAALLLAVD